MEIKSAIFGFHRVAQDWQRFLWKLNCFKGSCGRQCGEFGDLYFGTLRMVAGKRIFQNYNVSERADAICVREIYILFPVSREKNARRTFSCDY